METITINRLKYLYDKATKRIEKENKANGSPTTTHSEKVEVDPDETKEERNKRVILSAIQRDKDLAQKYGGRSVRY
jgi:hypothetical protein